MLRQVQSEHLGLLLSAFQVTTTVAPAATIESGANDGSVARNSAGNYTLTLRDAGIHKRGPLAFITPAADIADGGYCHAITVPAANAANMRTLGAGGSSDDGSSHLLLAGWQQSETDLTRFPQQLVKATWPNPLIMGFSIADDGAIVSGGTQGTVVKNDTGDYTINFTPAMSRACIALLLPYGVGNAARVVTLTANALNYKTTEDDGTALDAACDVIILGSLSREEVGRMRRPLQCPQTKPRIIAGRIDGTGTAAILIGGATNGASVALTDNGTGDYTVDFTKPFKRPPVVIASTVAAGRIALEARAEINEVTFLSSLTNGTPADADFDFLVLGYDDDTEF